jgi:hypothetical protein
MMTLHGRPAIPRKRALKIGGIHNGNCGSGGDIA